MSTAQKSDAPTASGESGPGPDPILSHIAGFAEDSRKWSRAFDPAPLGRFVKKYETGSALPAMRRLVDQNFGSQIEFKASALAPVFGDITSSHHCFRYPSLGWLDMTEPMVTRAFAYLLDRGIETVKNKRMFAFLKALGTPNLPDDPESLSGFKVKAEKDRIDLEVWLPIHEKTEGKEWRPIIVEAKFGHDITEGQLSGYLERRERDGIFDMRQKYCVILALTKGTMSGLDKDKGEDKIWNFVSWYGLWLGFETNRPREENPELAIFLHELWDKIGDFIPESA